MIMNNGGGKSDANVANEEKKDKAEGEWTKEEMEKAQPFPMPEVPDED